jgi:hypothetical protein
MNSIEKNELMALAESLEDLLSKPRLVIMARDLRIDIECVSQTINLIETYADSMDDTAVS